MEAALLAGLFELGGKLRAAVDLDGADGKRHAVLQSVEELRGGEGGGAGMSLEHIPAGNHIASGELFKDHAGNGTPSKVSTSTRSPGSAAAYSLGLRTA